MPPEITPDFVRDWVRGRVSEKRLRHIEGVAMVASQLAMKAGCDPYLAEIAGLLHDACKQIKDTELVAMADRYGLILHPIERANGHLLHGPVAALVARHELNITNDEVLNAIAEHTLGAAPMSSMSEVMFLADCLDDTRPGDYTEPIWKALDFEDAFDLPRAIVVACNLGLGFLIADGKPIHPKTIEVRNYYLARLRDSPDR